MIVLKHGLKIYQPKLSIESCIILEQLYGSITAPIEKHIPSLSEQVFLISLCLRQYNLSEDELYELFDEIDDAYSLIITIYEEAGLINTKQDSNASERQETTSNDKITDDTPQTFEEMCNDMLVQCLAIGLSRQEFFNSTLKEITQFVDAYKKQQQNKLEEQAYFDWMLANLIGSSVARLMSKDAKFPKLEEAYPFVKDNKPQQPVDDKGLTSEEKQASLAITEWAMAMQRKKEKAKAKEQKQQPKEDRVTE
jgi:hypothetical protein